MGVEVVGEAVMAGEAAVTEWAEEVEVTLLSPVVMHSADSQAEVTLQSRVVIHLADSQAVALVRDSAGCG
jgi:hypothetical protein